MKNISIRLIMDMVQYFADELKHAIDTRDTIMQSGLVNSQPAVYQLNALIRKLDATIVAYGEAKDKLDEIATSNPEFGSNRMALKSQMGTVETLKGEVESIINSIQNIENETLKLSGIYSYANNYGSIAPTAGVVINRSNNAFPECIPSYKLEMPNNLYLIKDKELEEYDVKISDFLNVCRKLYDELSANGIGTNYAKNISELSLIIKSCTQVLNTVNDLLAKKSYYNNTCTDIPVDSPQYEEYASYPDTYKEALSIISDIYKLNSEKFDEISRNLD